jgi:hypothetical protein
MFDPEFGNLELLNSPPAGLQFLTGPSDIDFIDISDDIFPGFPEFPFEYESLFDSDLNLRDHHFGLDALGRASDSQSTAQPQPPPPPGQFLLKAPLNRFSRVCASV